MASLLAQGFVIEDGCVFEPVGGIVVLSGKIHCQGGITITVNKVLEYVSGEGISGMVMTSQFSYHASVHHVAGILRYCSQDDHRPFAHKHVLDPFNGGKELEIQEIRDVEKIPTLREMIDEVRDWYEENADKISGLSQ
jgi:hypothetical protein